MQINPINCNPNFRCRSILMNTSVLNAEEKKLMEPVLKMTKDGMIDEDLLKVLKNKFPALSNLFTKMLNGVKNPTQEAFNTKINKFV